MRLTDEQAIEYMYRNGHFSLPVADYITKRLKEIEQLQAQVAELRDSLKWLKSLSFSHEDDLEQWPSQKTREEIEHALSESAGADYHNPADVAEIEQLKYLLRLALPILEVSKEEKELVEAIDKVIGGKEDV